MKERKMKSNSQKKENNFVDIREILSEEITSEEVASEEITSEEAFLIKEIEPSGKLVTWTRESLSSSLLVICQDELLKEPSLICFTLNQALYYNFYHGQWIEIIIVTSGTDVKQRRVPLRITIAKERLYHSKDDEQLCGFVSPCTFLKLFLLDECRPSEQTTECLTFEFVLCESFCPIPASTMSISMVRSVFYEELVLSKGVDLAGSVDSALRKLFESPLFLALDDWFELELDVACENSLLSWFNCRLYFQVVQIEPFSQNALFIVSGKLTQLHLNETPISSAVLPCRFSLFKDSFYKAHPFYKFFQDKTRALRHLVKTKTSESSLLKGLISNCNQLDSDDGTHLKNLLQILCIENGINFHTIDCLDLALNEAYNNTVSVSLNTSRVFVQLKALEFEGAFVFLLQNPQLCFSSEQSGELFYENLADFCDLLTYNLLQAQSSIGTNNLFGILVISLPHSDRPPGFIHSWADFHLRNDLPSETQRFSLLQTLFRGVNFTPKPSDLEQYYSQLSKQTLGFSLTQLAKLLNLSISMASTLTGSVCVDQAFVLNCSALTSSITKIKGRIDKKFSSIKIPSVHWDDIGGLEQDKAQVMEMIQTPLKYPSLFKSGLKKRSGVLLCGPPGTGKTLLAKAIATECSLKFISIKGPELLNMYVGESENNVRQIFKKAKDNAPSLIFFDELDSLAPRRGASTDSGGALNRIVSQLLTEIDALDDDNGSQMVFLLGATNRSDLLDPALLRPGRFDQVLQFGLATSLESAVSILKALTKKFQLQSDVSLEKLATLCTLPISGAELYGICSSASLHGIQRLIKTLHSEFTSSTISSKSNEQQQQWSFRNFIKCNSSKYKLILNKEDFLYGLNTTNNSSDNN